MSALPPGPYASIPCPGATPAPFYMLPFDKRGVCMAPATRARLLEDAGAGGYTDIFVFSHGWNNDWPTAVGTYRSFINHFVDMVQSHKLPLPTPFRPLLIGIYWPSAALTFGDEDAPAMAAATPEVQDQAAAAEDSRVRDLADELPAADAARFYTLLQQERLTQADVVELVTLAAPIFAGGEDEVAGSEALTPDDVAAVWMSLPAPADRPFGSFGAAGGFGAAGAGAAPALDPSAAGDSEAFLDPRLAIRGLTVYQMKDRAGKVGAAGVGPLLRDLLAGTAARLHGIGHSYGCRVLLSAISSGDRWPRPLHSLLLLQGAISHLCFASKVDGAERPGGYRPALDRVALPILCTYSQNDLPLHQFYHLILRRPRDLGELQIAAAAVPSRFAALGGYGPRGSDETMVAVLDTAAVDAGRRYDVSRLIPVIGIDGTPTINGHGDINNLSTWWMLYNLVAP